MRTENESEEAKVERMKLCKKNKVTWKADGVTAAGEPAGNNSEKPKKTVGAVLEVSTLNNIK